jgi:hypothetical protein
VVIWYISTCFGILYQEKSGNPALHENKKKSALPKFEMCILHNENSKATLSNEK